MYTREKNEFIGITIDPYPFNLQKWQRRKTIRLGKEYYDEFPQELLLLQKLETLDLSRTIIKEIPIQLNQITTLKHLILPLTMQWIPQGLAEFLKESTLPRPIVKKLKQEGITLKQAVTAKELNVVRIPENIGLYVNLESLHTKQILSTIPRSLWSLSHLQILQIDLMDVEIPDDITKLTNLMRLDLGHYYGDLPQSLISLPNLKELHLRNTAIQDQDVISKLPNLEVLTIYHDISLGFLDFSSDKLKVLKVARSLGSSLSDFSRFPNLEELVLSDYIALRSFTNPLEKIKKLHLYGSNANLAHLFIQNPKILQPRTLEELVLIDVDNDKYHKSHLPLIYKEAPNLKKLKLVFKNNGLQPERYFYTPENLTFLYLDGLKIKNKNAFVASKKLNTIKIINEKNTILQINTNIPYILPQSVKSLVIQNHFFPINFEGVSDLQELRLKNVNNLKDNKTTINQKNIDKLINLTKLVVTGKLSNYLQNNIHHLPKLTHFYFDTAEFYELQQLQTISQNLLKLIDLKHFTFHTKAIDTNRYLPRSFYRLETLIPFLRIQALENLKIQTTLTNLPEDMPVPLNLKSITIKYIEPPDQSFLSWFKKLNKLESIQIESDADFNQQSIISDFSSFPNVKALFLNFIPLYNKLNIEGLVNLEKVAIVNCKLTILPDDICNNKNLILLQLSDNELLLLPQCLGNLKKLKILDVSNNILTTLPPLFGFVESSLVFNIPTQRLIKYSGNPIHHQYNGDHPGFQNDQEEIKYRWIKEYFKNSFASK